MTTAPAAESSLSGPLPLPENVPPCCSSALVELLTAQVKAINGLMDAIDRLAQSNEAMVDALMAGEDEEGAGSQHL